MKMKTEVLQIRLTKKQKIELKKKADSTGLSMTELVIEASKRVRTWTAKDKKTEQKKIREIARIGNNLNQIARYCNIYKNSADTFEIVQHLTAIERELKCTLNI